MDKQTEHAAAGVKERHLRVLREQVTKIESDLGWLKRDLDLGKIPRGSAQRLLAEAQEIQARVNALEAHSELAEIYAADGT